MRFVPTGLRDAAVIDVDRHADDRGHLARTFDEREFERHGVPLHVVQASTIFSPRRATLRGLHFQAAPHAEIKLVRCTAGAAHVVIVDLRPASETYLRSVGVDLSPRNGRLLYVPEGFAQGYQTIEDETEVFYQMSREYVPEAATGVRWDDPAFAIAWPPVQHRIISERDLAWPDYAPAALAG